MDSKTQAISKVEGLGGYLSRAIFVGVGILALSGQLNSATALLIGAVLALSLGNPFLESTRKWIHRLLSLAVIGLGMEMNLNMVGKAGMHGLGYTALGISLALGVGLLLRRLLKADSDVSLLITVGTAICGGSAIAAVAPVIRAKHHQVTVALATVFLLNALALILFPWIGSHLSLTQQQFGLWSALAIHDTSSVVGATLQYGKEALEVGTTVKLARALWIVPMTLAIGTFYRQAGQEGEKSKPKRPWFILGFILAAALVTYVPALHEAGAIVGGAAKRVLVLTLFLIGSGLTWNSLRSVGVRALLLGITLWLIVATLTLTAILQGWIS